MLYKNIVKKPTGKLVQGQEQEQWGEVKTLYKKRYAHTHKNPHMEVQLDKEKDCSELW